MFCKIYSGGINGISGFLVQVEVDVNEGLPSFIMVGMLSSEVKEAGERVRSALKNSGFRLEPKRITVNLSPADIRKEGALYDLPIAAAILTNFGYLPEYLVRQVLILGELSLDGSVNPVKGVLPIVYAAKESGIKLCIVPWLNAKEGAVIEGVRVYGVKTLKEMIDILKNQEAYAAEQVDIESYFIKKNAQEEEDFSQVNGQAALKRAVEVAAAGMHNMLMIGSPGSGKTMIARRIPTILPALELSECIEITKIYSVAGHLPAGEALIPQRPFRAPHHTISAASLAGGGRIPHPGEVSLANRGVLFLDEFPEFQKNTLEILRQPMEDRKIVISRLSGSCEFPTNFMLVAAMNPCRCGYYPDRNRCRCSEQEVGRYQSRISRPLLDRMDICMEAPRLSYQELNASTANETSQAIRLRVEQARRIQKMRYTGIGIHTNSELSGAQINQYCKLGRAERRILEQAYEKLALTARGVSRILKVARTIADLEGIEEVMKEHVSEAICYRVTDRMMS